MVKVVRLPSIRGYRHEAGHYGGEVAGLLYHELQPTKLWKRKIQMERERRRRIEEEDEATPVSEVVFVPTMLHTGTALV